MPHTGDCHRKAHGILENIYGLSESFKGLEGLRSFLGKDENEGCPPKERMIYAKYIWNFKKLKNV